MKVLHRMEQNEYAWSYLQCSSFICSLLINPHFPPTKWVTPAHATSLLLSLLSQTFTSLLSGGFFEDRSSAQQDKFCSPVLKKSP